MPRTAAQLAYAAVLLAAVCVLVTWRSSHFLLDGSTALIEKNQYDPEITPKKIYKDEAGIDLDHPNRIDNYDCFFNDCTGGNDESLVGTGLLICVFDCNNCGDGSQNYSGSSEESSRQVIISSEAIHEDPFRAGFDHH